MNKLFITSLTALTLIVPAIADPVTPNIAVGTNPADCTEPVLGTTSGTSNLQANWTANTLNLEWTAPDADNWSAQNNTCTYDSGITVPQTNPSRTGYTFAGWHVKVAPTPVVYTSCPEIQDGTTCTQYSENGCYWNKYSGTNGRCYLDECEMAPSESWCTSSVYGYCVWENNSCVVKPGSGSPK